ncbi:uncharacterized protein LOC108673102 [Hyalella azteca]|uniref:Uncharacterized protein LOC108673102 n=1 Tax=Hyalella azteca TaxID=294128 RepID=A0A8B7NRN5_HYAAZ|nr:uncharacterized protein LOC108673102 [Hyalella azteca]
MADNAASAAPAAPPTRREEPFKVFWETMTAVMIYFFPHLVAVWLLHVLNNEPGIPESLRRRLYSLLMVSTTIIMMQTIAMVYYGRGLVQTAGFRRDVPAEASNSPRSNRRRDDSDSEDTDDSRGPAWAVRMAAASFGG